MEYTASDRLLDEWGDLEKGLDNFIKNPLSLPISELERIQQCLAEEKSKSLRNLGDIPERLKTVINILKFLQNNPSLLSK